MNRTLQAVVDRVQQARVSEQQTRDAAAKAKADREKAERELGPARAEAEALQAAATRQAQSRLAELEKELAQAVALEASDQMVPPPSLRIRARMYLCGGSDAAASDKPYSAAEALMSICTIDRVSGAFLNCSQASGRAMKWANEIGADDDLYVQFDTVECKSWSALKRRIVSLAGEDVL